MSGFYFVTGNDGTIPYYTVKAVSLIDSTHAIADIVVQQLYDFPDFKELLELKEWHTITMVKVDDRWLLDDYDTTKAQCEVFYKSATAQVIEQ